MDAPPSSSDAPAPPAANSTNTPSPTPPALAFFNHSPETLNQSRPSNQEQSAPRQKRKRTSKEDEEILKAEFRKNPKPDKATRMEIVNKVAMGEKEVQIWFQNRRQNERRRARPSISDAPPDSSSDAHFTSPASSQESAAGEAQNSARLPQKDVLAASQSSEAVNGVSAAAVNPASVGSTSTLQSESLVSAATAATALCTSQSLPSSQESFTSSVPRSGYLANRRSASFVRAAEEEKPGRPTPETPKDQAREGNSLRRTHSSIRLSMTADGQAKVVTSDDQSPSPPRARPQLNENTSRSLRRSYSAVELEETPPPPRAFKYSRASLGRSRDSRAWEFWCDSDARNSLTDKAEQEGSGSAADAIGLIRANSRGALKPLVSRANTPTMSPANRVQKATNGKTKRAFVRSHTSNGRLQSSAVKHATPQRTKDGKASDSGDFEIPNNESDKENWEPGMPRTLHAAASKAAADDRRKRQRRDNPESNIVGTVNVEDDAEIAQFMGGGGGGHATISNGEELGCVEGLLKLSRGGWR